MRNFGDRQSASFALAKKSTGRSYAENFIAARVVIAGIWAANRRTGTH